MDYQDKTLQCTDPAHEENTSEMDEQSQSKEFVFSADEQAFYAEKGFSEPQRCPACRAAKKARFNSRGRGGDRQMFSATCAQCGREDQVPFEPKDGRPVYCTDCFQQQRATA